MIARSLVMGMATARGSYLPSHVPVPRALISYFSFFLPGQSSNVRRVCCGREVLALRRRMKWDQTVGRRIPAADRETYGLITTQDTFYFPGLSQWRVHIG